MKRLRVVGLSVALLSAGVCWLAMAGGASAPAISAGDYKKLVDTEAKLIQDMLAKGTVDEKTNKKTRAVAMLIAGYAALTKDDKAAARRDAALTLVAAMDKSDVKQAQAIAGQLANPKASAKQTIALAKAVDFDVVMRLFSRLGIGLERELDEMMELKTHSADQFDKLTVLGYRLATIGELSTHFVPEKDEGKKTRKSWSQLAGDLRASSIAVAEAAKTKKSGDVVQGLERVAVSCKKCHEIFRDAE